MDQSNTSQLLSLLQKINAVQIVETFRNFPDIIRLGAQSLPREDFDFLCAEGYLEEKAVDSFGRFLQLSSRARNLLQGTA